MKVRGSKCKPKSYVNRDENTRSGYHVNLELSDRMSFMTWTRLTIHWIVSDCDLRKVSVYTPSKGCVGLHVVWIIYKC